eukprot:1428252-Pleurochrysis_carterae.AAC.1
MLLFLDFESNGHVNGCVRLENVYPQTDGTSQSTRPPTKLSSTSSGLSAPGETVDGAGVVGEG